MRADLEEHLTAVPRRLRLRHGEATQLLDGLLGAGERVRAAVAGMLSGVGPVLVVATNRRVLAAGRDGWNLAVLYSQISSVDSGGWLGHTVVIQSAGTVYAVRASRATQLFTATVQAGIPSGAPTARLATAI
ncbi:MULTISPECIES: hypothetical protein [unclassified Crossiella]|uniref:hypothetical protein n=2 Tax=unclassified Crossiella TaxID=2620835 RepID=UPI0024BD1415|nr:hypothetical protein [Crossiella sp. CA-258035]WHT19816.1 hypothetical protein N8J89_01675 [Crossiella sp. CA-258035]